jgi:hypothetical protein
VERLEAPEVDLHVLGGGEAGEAEAEERRRRGFVAGAGAEGKRLRADGWGGGDGGRGVGGEQDGLLEVVHGSAEESGGSGRGRRQGKGGEGGGGAVNILEGLLSPSPLSFRFCFPCFLGSAAGFMGWLPLGFSRFLF